MSYSVITTAESPDWLEKKLDYVSGSEMATVMGRAPSWFSQTREDLIREKRAKVVRNSQPNRRMWWGTAAEKSNIEAFAKLSGARVRPSHAMLAKDGTRISCTLDGLVKAPSKVKYELPWTAGGKGDAPCQAAWTKFCEQFSLCEGLGLLEAKQSDGWPKQVEEWTEAPPEYYWCQVQCGLYVTGLAWGVLFARLGVADIRAHVIAADEVFFWEMEQAVDTFWKEVEHG